MFNVFICGAWVALHPMLYLHCKYLQSKQGDEDPTDEEKAGGWAGFPWMSWSGLTEQEQQERRKARQSLAAASPSARARQPYARVETDSGGEGNRKGGRRSSREDGREEAEIP